MSTLQAKERASDPQDNVIAISTKFTDAAPVEMLQHRYDACRHEHTILDDKLRTVACRDCGEERLDPFEVLSRLARQWRMWQHEADVVRKLNAEYRDNQRAKWRGARDRHLGANPDHARRFVTLPDGEQVPIDGGGTIPRDCRPCGNLFLHFDSRWVPSRAPEPPSGKLDPA